MIQKMSLTAEDQEALREAHTLLTKPGLAARLADLFGRPLESVFRALPKSVHGSIEAAVQKAVRQCLDVAVNSLGKPGGPRADLLHRVATGVAGAAGGAFGLAALAVELPVTTTVMMRSIADIARRQGEDLRDPEARLACLSVFALGGRGSQDDASESGYYAIRAMLAKTVSDTARYIAERGLAEEGAPVLVRFLATIASRFGVVVSEKAAAQAVPVIGAAGGATINVLFMEHFQNVARGHFTIRRLERRYGAGPVRAEYEQLG